MGNNSNKYNDPFRSMILRPEYLYTPIVGRNPIGQIIENIKDMKAFYERNEKWDTVHILQNMQLYFENKLNGIKKGIVK